jgi:hypothetical protein
MMEESTDMGIILAILVAIAGGCFIGYFIIPHNPTIDVAYSDGFKDGYVKGWFDGQDSMIRNNLTINGLYEGYCGESFCLNLTCKPRTIDKYWLSINSSYRMYGYLQNTI